MSNKNDTGAGEALLLLGVVILFLLCWRHIVHYLGGV